MQWVGLRHGLLRKYKYFAGDNLPSSLDSNLPQFFVIRPEFVDGVQEDSGGDLSEKPGEHDFRADTKSHEHSFPAQITRTAVWH